MLPKRKRRHVLKLVVVHRIQALAAARTSARERPHYSDGRIEAQGRLVVRLTTVAKTGLVHNLCAHHLCVAHVDRVFGIIRVVRERREVKLPDTVVGPVVFFDLVAHGEDIVGSHLVVETRAELRASLRGKHRLAERNRVEVRVQDESTYDRAVLNVTPPSVEEERSLLTQRPADVPVEEDGMVRRYRGRKRVPRIERRIVEIEE